MCVIVGGSSLKTTGSKMVEVKDTKMEEDEEGM